MQDRRTMGLQHAFGPAGRAGGVAKRRPRALVELRPVELLALVAAGAAQEEVMLGVMSEQPLLISAILTHAAIYHRDTGSPREP